VGTASSIRVMMEAVTTSEMAVYSETTWHYIPEASKLYPHLCKNLTSRKENTKIKTAITKISQS
jgi:hypothetical protein